MLSENYTEHMPPTANTTAPQPGVVYDPYRKCLEMCTHDLARGVLISELHGGDGPHEPPIYTRGWGMLEAIRRRTDIAARQATNAA